MSGTKNTIGDLRDHLFAQLENLSDPQVPVDKERVKLLCQVSQNIINSAKVEVDFIKATQMDKSETRFFNQKQLS